MGRWAQRRRGGGGPNPLNQIISASIQGPVLIEAVYAAPVDGAGFDVAVFESDPSAEQSSSYSIGPSTTLQIFFDFSVIGDTSLTYSGTTPGILSPQTVPLT